MNFKSFSSIPLIKPKTVDSVMQVFTKTIADLDAVAAAADAKALALKAQRDDLFAAQAAAEYESCKAADFSAKLSKLLGV